MLRFLKFRLVAAAIAVACVVGSASPAKAAFNLYMQEAGVNNGDITLVAAGSNFTPFSVNGTYGDFNFEITGGSAHNAATLSDLIGSSNFIMNSSGTTQTLKIYLQQTDYFLPVGPQLRVESGMSGTNNVGSVNPTNIFQAFYDPADGGGLSGPSGSVVLGGLTGGTNGAQTAVLNTTTWDTGSATGTFTRTGFYSLTSLATLTMTGGAQINFVNHINVANAVPAPAGVILVASVLPFVAVLRRRLRKSDVVTAA